MGPGRAGSSTLTLGGGARSAPTAEEVHRGGCVLGEDNGYEAPSLGDESPSLGPMGLSTVRAVMETGELNIQTLGKFTLLEDKPSIRADVKVGASKSRVFGGSCQRHSFLLSLCRDGMSDACSLGTKSARHRWSRPGRPEVGRPGG